MIVSTHRSRTFRIAQFVACMFFLAGAGVGATVADGIEVRFERPDGAVLKGTWTLAGDGKQPAVLLLHQAGSSRSEFDFLLPELHARGWHTLAIDLRGHGESTKPETVDRAFYTRLFTDPEFAPPDVEQMIQWLVANESVDSRRIAILGGSVGANLAYKASGSGWGVRTVVALSGNAENANLLADKIDEFKPRNVFLLAADDDHGRDVFARKMYEQAGEPRRVEIQEHSSAHGVAILASSPELKLAVLDWLSSRLASR